MTTILAGSLITLCVSALFIPCVLTLAVAVFEKTTNDSYLIASLNQYLSISVWSVPMLALSSVLRGGIRALGYTGAASALGVCSVVFYTIFAIVLIYGFLGFPAMGILGAPTSLLIASCLRLLMMISLLAVIRGELKFVRSRFASVCRSILKLIFPLFAAECIWVGGLFGYGAIASLGGSADIAASQVAISIQNVILAALSGLPVAAMLNLSQLEGYSHGQRIIYESVTAKFALYVSMVMSLLIVPVIVFSDVIYSGVFNENRSLPAMIAICIPIIFVGTYANVLGMGILIARGNTSIMLISDIAATLAIGIPLAYALAVFFDFGVVGVFWGRLVEEGIRSLVLTVGWKRLFRQDDIVRAG
jgi:Na+-driven multidrug efflux pump